MTQILGTIADSAGNALTGAFTVELPAIATIDTTVPDTVFLPVAYSFDIIGGDVDIDVPETETSQIAYSMTFTPTGETSPALSFNAIVPSTTPVQLASLIPTGVANTNLDTGAIRVARLIALDPNLARLFPINALPLLSDKVSELLPLIDVLATDYLLLDRGAANDPFKILVSDFLAGFYSLVPGPVTDPSYTDTAATLSYRLTGKFKSITMTLRDRRPENQANRAASYTWTRDEWFSGLGGEWARSVDGPLTTHTLTTTLESEAYVFAVTWGVVGDYLYISVTDTHDALSNTYGQVGNIVIEFE